MSGHQRFLLTGVKVGLESADSGGSSTKEKSDYVEKVSETASSRSMSSRGSVVPLTGETNEVVSGQIGGVGTFLTSKVQFSDVTTPGNIPEWHLDELLSMTNVNPNYESVDNDSSKVCFMLQYNLIMLDMMYNRILSSGILYTLRWDFIFSVRMNWGNVCKNDLWRGLQG